MRYFHITLCPISRKLCTIVLPRGKFGYQIIRKILYNRPDIFQEKINELFNGLEYVTAYIDDLFIISNGIYEDHLNKVKIVLKKLKANGFKINTE